MASRRLRKLETLMPWIVILGSLKDAVLDGQQLWERGGRRVVITEGSIDKMTVSQLQDNKWPVVSIPNGVSSAKKAISSQLEWLCSFEEVVLMFDMDEPGRKVSVSVSSKPSTALATIHPSESRLWVTPFAGPVLPDVKKIAAGSLRGVGASATGPGSSATSLRTNRMAPSLPSSGSLKMSSAP